MSDTGFIEVVGIEGSTIEFWATEHPDYCSAKMGQVHPSYVLDILAAAHFGKTALSTAFGPEGDAGFTAWRTQIAREVDRYIASVTLVAAVDLGTRKAEIMAALAGASNEAEAMLDHAPRALFSVVVTDPQFLAHLHVGQQFGVASPGAFLPEAVARAETRQRKTASALRPLIELAASPWDEERFHLYRRAPQEPGRWIQRSMPWLPSGGPDVEAFREPLILSRQLQAMALEAGNTGGFVVFDKRAPKFAAEKFAFKEVPNVMASLKAKESKMRLERNPAGPFGMQLHLGDAERQADGVWRICLSKWTETPGEEAWVDAAAPSDVHFRAGYPAALTGRSMPLAAYLAYEQARIASLRE